MIRAIIDFIISVWKAIFKLKDSIQSEQVQEQQEHLQEHQEHLQNQYDKIDEQHQTNPNPTLQEVADKLNEHF